MFSKAFAEQSKQLLTSLDVEKGAHAATARCLDAMAALAVLHREAMAYAVAAQTAFESALEAEDKVGSERTAEYDAEQAQEAKEGFEQAVRRFNDAIARLTVE
jgi:TnpA family transposase